VQSLIRDLPSRVVVYLLLTACLFPELGYPGAWAKLTAGLSGLPVAAPTAGALAQARRRVGVAPLRFLFDLLRGAAAIPRGCGTRWRGMLVCAIDGTTLTVPDSAANLTRFTRGGGSHGGTGYPQARLLALVACGTRTLIDAVSGPTTSGETTYAPGLLRSLRAGMVVLADRNFAAAALIAAIARTEADVLVRVKNGRKLPALRRYRDGSYLSRMGAIQVRGHRGSDHYRHQRRPPHRNLPAGHYPARSPRLPGSRADHAVPPAVGDRDRLPGTEIHPPRRPGPACPHPRRNRPGDLRPAGHLPDPAHRDGRCATACVPGTGPDRASFTIAWQTARDQLIQAAGIIASTVIDLIGTIGRHVLAGLMPARRLRVSPRIVKRAISKYQARGPGIGRTSYKATVSIDILAPTP